MDSFFPTGLEDELPAPFAPSPLLGVLFAEDFDGPMVIAAEPGAGGALPEPEIAAPVFGEADLAAARADGFAAGQRAAAEAAAKARAADRVAALERIAAGLAYAGAEAASAVEQAVEGTAALLLQMVCRMLPVFSAAHGEGELRMLVRSLLPALTREPRATIRVNPLHLDALGAELGELDPESAQRIALVAAPAMAAGDAAIAWEAGSAKREAAAIQAAIEAALAGLGLLAPKSIRPGADEAAVTQPGKQDAGRELEHVG